MFSLCVLKSSTTKCVQPCSINLTWVLWLWLPRHSIASQSLWSKVCLRRQVTVFLKPWTPCVSEKHRGRFTEPLTRLGRLQGCPGRWWQHRSEQNMSSIPGSVAPLEGGKHCQAFTCKLQQDLCVSWRNSKWKISVFMMLHLSSEIQFPSPVSAMFVCVLHVIKALHKIACFWI